MFGYNVIKSVGVNNTCYFWFMRKLHRDNFKRKFFEFSENCIQFHWFVEKSHCRTYVRLFR